MDLIYMSDVVAYQTLRDPLYEKYSWEQQQENNIQKKVNQPVQKKSKDKGHCKICQERQRRSLMKYIRSKSQDHSEHNIQEEVEEEEDEQEEEENKKEEQQEEAKESNKEKKEEAKR